MIPSAPAPVSAPPVVPHPDPLSAPFFTPSATNLPANALFSSLSTFNITSASQYSNAATRQTKSKRIKPITNAHAISFWQETKLLAKDDGRLTPFFSPSHSLFLSNNPLNTQTDCRLHTAGIATSISNTYLANFHNPTIHDLNPTLAGHALLVLLTHKTSGHTIALLNIRLSANDARTRDLQLNSLFYDRSHPFPTHHFLALAGDFNFNTSAEDSSFLSPPRIPPLWDAIISNFHLQEMKQDLPTYISIASRSADRPCPRIQTSRLDRIYLSLTEAHLSSLHPLCQILPVKLKDGFCCHLPVSLSLNPISHTPSHYSRVSIPPWTISHKYFISTFTSLYTNPPQTLHKRLTYFKSTLYRTKKVISRLAKEASSVIHQLQICVKALRISLSPCYVSTSANRIRLLARSYPPLLKLISQNLDDLSWNTCPLVNHINSLYFTHGDLDPCHLRQPHDNPPLRPFNPSFTPPNISRSLKIILPSSRPRTTQLRDSFDPSYSPNLSQANQHMAPLTKDPDKLARLIQDYWGNLWSRPTWPSQSERTQSITNHLQNYHKVIDASLIHYPSMEIVLQALAHSGDSAVGPDGIPFSAYRALANITAPLLLDIAIHLGTPHSSLKNFNTASLLLIPKDDTGWTDHQRPLGINNTDNRLVANIYLLCTLEGIQKLVDPAQKMFLPGRLMTDHIRLFNNLFYTAINDDLDFFIFFFDNIKAFDSMYHDYIHAVLLKQGFPLWFLYAISNLLDNAILIPTLAPDARLEFLKGVKQGCPLSPVIFILIYDVLITYLKDAAPTDTWVAGAADDLALGARRLPDLLGFLPIIDYFTLASGLRINRTKTGLLTSRPSRTLIAPRDQIRTPAYGSNDLRPFLVAAPPPPLWQITDSARTHTSILATTSWPNVTLLDKHKYLGVLFANGHINNKTLLGAIFQPPLDKALKRLSLFRHSLSHMSLHKRILSVNIFVTPLFSYLITFFIIPNDQHHTYRRAIMKTIIPFGGTGIAYEHLVVPPSLMGPHSPLNDLWILTATRQLWPHITTITPHTTPWGFLSNRPMGIYFFSPIIEDNRNLLVMEFLGPHYLNWSAHPSLQLNTITKKSLKSMLLACNFHQWNGRAAHHRTSSIYGCNNRQMLLHQRFSKYGDGNFHNALKHFSHIDKQYTRPHIITHHIKCYTNCLTTHYRLDKAHIRTITTSSYATPDRPFPCYLCPSGSDHIQHIYCDCTGLKDALTSLLSTNTINISFHDAILHSIALHNPTYHITFPIDDKHPRSRLHFILCLNYAIWQARARLKAAGGRFGPLSPGLLIATLTIALLSPKTSSKPPKGNKPFLSLISSPKFSSTDTLVFTNGRSLPDPGPCGAGILIIHSTHQRETLLNNPHTNLHYSLGINTGKYGELYAIGVAAQAIIDSPIHPAPSAYHFFIGNAWALRAAVTGLCKDRRYSLLAHQVHLLISRVLPRFAYLITGHSQNPGVAASVTLSSRGVKNSARHMYSEHNNLSPLPPPFLYHKLPP